MIRKECRKILMIMGCVMVLIFAYWVLLIILFGIRDMTHYDFLNQRVMDNPFTGSPLSCWPFTHFVLFMILGWMYPTCLEWLFGIGVTWELIEMTMASLFSQPYHFIRTTESVEYPNWWAGSTLDVGMNTIGLAVGWMLSQKLGVLRVKYLNLEDPKERRWIFIEK